MATIHIVPHTHWDREWYLPFQRFRLKLVHLIDGLLDLLATDPRYIYFMLDGQTIILEDYLEMRPDRENEIRSLVQSGRLLIGPWYVMPDEFLVSPEAIIRNLLQGDRNARHFGAKLKVGYIPDTFGHIGQMPQILNGFDIQAASVQRGLDEEPCEVWWQAPDGSRVLMAYLRDGYGNVMNLPANDPPAFLQLAHSRASNLQTHSNVSQILLMFGYDHTEPDPATSTAIRYSNQNGSMDRYLHSTLPAYLQAVRAEINTRHLSLPVIQGELRSSRRHHLLPGVLSTRVWIKQRNHSCETLLERWAEPFSLFASQVMQPRVPSSNRLEQPVLILRQAWKLLMKCHPHDSICGCSIDQVHKEMRPRFDQVEQIGEEITSQSLRTIAAAVDTRFPLETPEDAQSELIPLVVFNACDQPLTGEASAQINLPSGMGVEILTADGESVAGWIGEENVQHIAHLELNREELFEFVNSYQNGRVSGPGIQDMILQDLQIEQHADMLEIRATLSENGGPNLKALTYAMQTMATVMSNDQLQRFVLDASLRNVRLHFVAQSVPPHGYQTYWAMPVEEVSRQPSGQTKPSVIRNEFLEVEASSSEGTLTVTDLRTGRRYAGLNRFLDGGDCGDEYNYCPPSQDNLMQPQLRAIEVNASSPGQCITVDLELALPDGLSEGRDARAAEVKAMRIRTTARLLPGVARVDVHTWVNNPAGDHRLRVHFPAPFSAESTGYSAAYDGHFEVVERPMGLPQWDQSWVEKPVPQHPMRNFCTVSNGNESLTIANRGLREAEALENPTGQAEIALTLLRCTGWLSRDDFPTRHGPAGPFLETPGAQMLGDWEFDYAIFPHSRNWKSAVQPASAFNVPLRAIVEETHAGSLPANLSFIQTNPETFIISAVKACEDGSGWLLRGANLEGQTRQVRLKLWRPFDQAARANLLEQPQEQLPFESDAEITFSAGAHQIITFRFE
ncbi:MAG: glycoside hydrolase family 38 C-terminal domain-containing protein [Anaerolineales bacterium]